MTPKLTALPTNPDTKVKVIFSEQGKYFYLADFCMPDGFWLEAEKHDGEVPEEKRHGKLDGYLQINHNDGRVWHRRSLPFAFFEVKSDHGRDCEMSIMEDMIIDYMMEVADKRRQRNLKPVWDDDK